MASKNVFCPEQILKEIDLSGCILNYEGKSILSNVKATFYIENNLSAFYIEIT
jgi:hypothetical protein